MIRNIINVIIFITVHYIFTLLCGHVSNFVEPEWTITDTDQLQNFRVPDPVSDPDPTHII